MQIFLFFALFIAILAILFAVQNNETTTVSFFIWYFDGSLALLLLIAMAVGALISFLISLPSNIRARWTIRNQRKKMTELEENLTDHKAMLLEAERKAELLEKEAAAKETEFPEDEIQKDEVQEETQEQGRPDIQ